MENKNHGKNILRNVGYFLSGIERKNNGREVSEPDVENIRNAKQKLENSNARIRELYGKE